ncbi:Choline-sulfatase [Cyclobacterium qasimii M12-11B]|uniref:Choline-sulfatase n=1 Tax=Cyclobacterium qasimii M12-11B TaxID=641524 RepID=S7VNA8_9BACT|nr:Choline-sulfatase [Cyclobacterium qasimii M12-11B]
MACKNSPKEVDKPNILWISHEDLGPIYGCYGDEYANTPTIDQLAANSIKFTQVYSNAPICAPARSTLITGMYAVSLGTQHLRSAIPVPEQLKILPEVLREAGYYTSNNVKTDYNFSHEGRWDESSKEAHWRNRPEGKPFFSVFNFMITHEGPTNALRPEDTSSLPTHHDPAKAVLPPHLPDSPKMREIWAHMYDLLEVFDGQVKDLLSQLEEDGLLEETIVLFLQTMDMVCQGTSAGLIMLDYKSLLFYMFQINTNIWWKAFLEQHPIGWSALLILRLLRLPWPESIFRK